MECKLQKLEDGRGWCTVCDPSKSRLLPRIEIRRDCNQKHSSNHYKYLDPSEKRRTTQLSIGPGTELKILLSRFGIQAVRDCECNKRTVIMDERGEKWCEDNIETIVGWLKEEATKRHLPFSKTLSRLMIKRAIRNSRKRKKRSQKQTETEDEKHKPPEKHPQKTKTVNTMKWAYGITTVPKRINDLLPRTITSLRKAGFDKPRLFVDGAESAEDYGHFDLKVTTRNPPLKTFGNWVLALAELYLREPQAERYAIFQDDFVTYLNLRQYLDQCKYPEKGYWNLYTFPANQKLAPKKNGWFLSNQRGKGAVALVFSRDAVTTLLKQSHIINRPQSAGKRRFQVVDGAIVDAFRKTGWKEYTHNPSLVQHTGKKSSIRGSIVPDSWLSLSFKGEEFNALTLQDTTVITAKKRIGLVGYHCESGLGEKNRQLSTYLDLDGWLICPHRHYTTLEPPQSVRTIVCQRGDKNKIKEFVRSVDVVVFDETPYYNILPTICKDQKRPMVCILAADWFPREEWVKQVSLFVCPTKQAYNLYHKEFPCVYFPWPVDVDRFKFKQRTRCDKFLFLNGRGGWKGRKGLSVIREAKRLWPEMPLAMRSQDNISWPDGVEVLPQKKCNADLYEQGDILLAPHSLDGTGLEPMEAMACGMPVVTTNGQPWNEIPAIGRITAEKTSKTTLRPIDWYLPNAQSLVDICKGLLGSDITKESLEAREWAESRSFSDKAQKLDELIRTVIP